MPGGDSHGVVPGLLPSEPACKAIIKNRSLVLPNSSGINRASMGPVVMSEIDKSGPLEKLLQFAFERVSTGQKLPEMHRVGFFTPCLP